MNTDEKLRLMDERISHLHSYNKIKNEQNEIDLGEMFQVIWENRLKIFGITLLFALASLTYALSLPNIYTSKIQLIPAKQSNSNSLSSLAGKYGGLAAMAGINLGASGDGNLLNYSVELMRSWPYIESIVNKHDLKPTLMAANGWDPLSDKLIFDEGIFDIKQFNWKVDKSSISKSNNSYEPSSYEVYKEVQSRFLSVKVDEELGVLSIEISHYSPQVAFDLVNILKEELNIYFRNQDRREALASLNFLNTKIESTNNKQLLEIFYSMIEQHTQTIMLTEISEEYSFKTLVPAKKAESNFKSRPKRALICILGTLLGAILAIFGILIAKYAFRKG